MHFFRFFENLKNADFEKVRKNRQFRTFWKSEKFPAQIGQILGIFSFWQV